MRTEDTYIRTVSLKMGCKSEHWLGEDIKTGKISDMYATRKRLPHEGYIYTHALCTNAHRKKQNSHGIT